MILFLSDVAGSEVLLILLFVLMFFGSKSIPGIARTMGKTMRQIKDASQDLQDEIRKSGVDMKNDLNIGRMLEETAQEIERPFYEETRAMNSAITFEAPKSFEMPENAIEAKTPPPNMLPESTETNTAESTEKTMASKESAEVPETQQEPVIDPELKNS